jgi:arsenite methyltransferase
MTAVSIDGAVTRSAEATKACCATLYSSDWARLLLGNSLHPGGLALTSRLAELLQIDADSRVLDVASGRGTSAIHLARTIGCRVVGIDLAPRNASAAGRAAVVAGVAELCSFSAGDAESLGLVDSEFDAIICECAFCTFPDKASAAGEFSRLLSAGRRVGLADITRTGKLRPELDGLLGRVACVADAETADGYAVRLRDAGLEPELIEQHDSALAELVASVRSRLLIGHIASSLRNISVPGWNFDRAMAIAQAAEDEIRAGRLGYAIVIASKH